MAIRKLSKVEIIIIVGFVASGLTLFGFWWGNKQGNRDFYLPQQYTGWVMVRYAVPDAPPLPLTDGVQQIHIPDSGILLTSSPLEIGWRKDRFFWETAEGSYQPIPPAVDQPSGIHLHIHQHQYFSRSYMDLARSLGDGEDTTLADGTLIERVGAAMINYEPGEKSLEHFYLSREPQPLQFQPPPNSRSQALETLDSRELLPQ
jgi:hypothetical protein